MIEKGGGWRKRGDREGREGGRREGRRERGGWRGVG